MGKGAEMEPFDDALDMMHPPQTPPQLTGKQKEQALNTEQCDDMKSIMEILYRWREGGRTLMLEFVIQSMGIKMKGHR